MVRRLDQSASQSANRRTLARVDDNAQTPQLDRIFGSPR